MKDTVTITFKEKSLELTQQEFFGDLLFIALWTYIKTIENDGKMPDHMWKDIADNTEFVDSFENLYTKLEGLRK